MATICFWRHFSLLCLPHFYSCLYIISCSIHTTLKLDFVKTNNTTYKPPFSSPTKKKPTSQHPSQYCFSSTGCSLLLPFVFESRPKQKMVHLLFWKETNKLDPCCDVQLLLLSPWSVSVCLFCVVFFLVQVLWCVRLQLVLLIHEMFSSFCSLTLKKEKKTSVLADRYGDQNENYSSRLWIIKGVCLTYKSVRREFFFPLRLGGRCRGYVWVIIVYIGLVVFGLLFCVFGDVHIWLFICFTRKQKKPKKRKAIRQLTRGQFGNTWAKRCVYCFSIYLPSLISSKDSGYNKRPS